MTAPTRRHKRALVIAVQAVNPALAAKLQAEIVSHLNRAKAIVAPAAPAAPPAPAKPTGAVALELAIFAMADELDLAPRRLRAALLKLLGRAAEAGFSVDSARQQVYAWVVSAQESAS